MRRSVILWHVFECLSLAEEPLLTRGRKPPFPCLEPISSYPKPAGRKRGNKGLAI